MSYPYCSISFKLTVTHHAPLSISKFGKGHASCGRLSKPPKHHTGLKIACKTQKAKIFDSTSKISLVSRQILAVVEMSNWFFGSRVTPRVDLNEILQYTIITGPSSKEKGHLWAEDAQNTTSDPRSDNTQPPRHFSNLLRCLPLCPRCLAVVSTL
jgi:hypothetical protein